MTINAKSNGAIKDIVVSFKRNAVYGAMQGIYAKAGGVYGRVDAETMALGMNVAWINSWSGAWVFSNLMYHSALDRASGTGTWSQDQGLVTTTDQNDVFRFMLADVETMLPAGEYTVLNPEGLQVQVGGYSVPGTWRTDTQFTFTRGSSGGARCVFVKGNVTNAAGNLAVIAPGHLAKWQAGNVWHDDFIAFHQGIGCSPLRLMDWTWASNNIESEWSHRAVATKPTLFTYAAGGQCVPYEFMCDLAARLNSDIWVCAPARATQDYIDQMAALFAAQMPTGRKVWLELSNEVWNTADPWGDGSEWISYLDHTRRTAAADVAGQKFILNGHGLSNAAQVRSFATRENRAARADQASAWQLRMGQPSYVKVLNVDEFELYADVSLTTKLTIPAGQVNHLFVVSSEAGKTAAMDTHYGEVCLRNWDAFDAAMGSGRVVHVVAVQAANTVTTVGRLAVSGVQARADFVAVAPYFGGQWCGARLVASDGSITPGWWAAGSSTVYIGVYAAGATPTVDQVVAGTGAVASQSYSYTAGANSYSSAAPVSGLANGTTYDVHFVFDSGGVRFRMIGSVSPSVGGSTSYVYDTYANQYLRHTLGSASSGVGTIVNHTAVSGGVPIVCYEGGLHYHHSAPSQMASWLATYQESATFAAAIQHDLACLASANCKMHAYYADVLGTTFSIANSFTDTADLRYGVFDALNGLILKKTKVDIANAAPDGVLTEPTYPRTVYTFPDAALTYRVINGDAAGNFAMAGAELRMVNGTGVNWASPTGRVLTIEASDGVTTDTATVSFSLGDAWYSADSRFAWDSIADTDNVTINPVIGNALARVAGSTYAPIADGLWDMDAVAYGASNAMTSGFSFGRPLLFAAVLDKDNHTGTYRGVLQVGSGSYLQFFVEASVNTSFNARIYTSTAAAENLAKFAATSPTGKHVYWAYWNGVDTLTAGYDQVTGSSATRASHAAATGTARINIGTDDGTTAKSNMKHGSTLFLDRAGLTLAQAKAIVAKMQAHHGIA